MHGSESDGHRYARPRAGPRGAAAVAVGAALLLVTAIEAVAQETVTLRAQLVTYGDNTEFSNPFREGETLLGSYGRLVLEVALNERVTVRAGVFGNHLFGDADGFEAVRPELALVIDGRAGRFVIGSLETMRRRDGPGPDRTGPHGLLPVLQAETLAFTRPHEAGFQWTLDTSRVSQEAWVNWQRRNTPAHRERFDAGLVGRSRIDGPWSLGYQAHVVHEGGQAFSTGPVADSVAGGPGLIFERPLARLDRLTGEFHVLASHWVPDRQQGDRTTTGAGGMARLAVEASGWRAHVLFWRGCDFIKDEGDLNYQSLRLDGRRFRPIRDYSEAGMTRTFTPAPGVGIELSARAHHTEGHYEYSYRVLASVDLGFGLWRAP